MKKTRLPILTRLNSGRPVPSRIGGAWSTLTVLAALLLFTGCSSSPSEYDVDGNQAAATFSGPTYLRGTIGSYGGFINNTPRYVGGYGMVVDLNATGSNEVPGFLRQWLITEMLRNNLGSVQFGTERFSPERVMADLGSSVVAVEGLIPPGARRGTKFDLLVTMVDQTSTSLAGGRLFWPTQLAPAGLDRRLIYTQTQGAGYGEIFVNPLSPSAAQDAEFLRTGVVVNGGTVLESQTVQFVLNQESHDIVNAIQDRINARFEAADSDNLPTAVGKGGGLLEINLPQRYAGQPAELFELVEHLYLDPRPEFVVPKAQQLRASLLEDPQARAHSVALAWKGLGPNAVPVLRPLYTHENPAVRAAALDAGSWLNDAQSLAPLTALAADADPAQRVRAAGMLIAMTRNREARMQVRQLLNDPDPQVRIGAYEALTLVGDAAVSRLPVTDGTTHKFYIDRVPSDYPMVYAMQGDDLAIVIFGDDIFLRDNVFSVIDETLAVRTLPVDSIAVGLDGRHIRDTAFIPIHSCGVLEQIPTLADVSSDPNDEQALSDWRITVGDNDGNSMLINIRSEPLQEAFGRSLLAVPNRGTPTPDPRAIAMVRIVREAGVDDQGNAILPMGELITLRNPDAPLPLAVRHRAPGQREATIYRINPTVANLAFTLGYKHDNLNVQTGPDLSFSQVVHALSVLCDQGQVPVPFDAYINPLAQRIVSAQRDNPTQTRAEITPQELQLLQDEDSQAPQPQDPATTPGTTPDSAPETVPESAPESTP